MFILNFIFGTFVVALGVVFLKFHYQIANMFSKNNIFERKLGSGSTYMVVQFFGLLIIFGGFALMFSLHDNILDWLLTPLLNALNLS